MENGKSSIREMLLETLSIYALPSQSMWRALELRLMRKLRRQIVIERPSLEIGCGDGAFSGLIFETIDDGIDVNSVSTGFLGQKSHPHKRLLRMDARSLDFSENSYRTVFANCVIEHIPDLDKVLANGYRVLMTGGRFIASVPLKEMDKHLFLKGKWYVSIRRRQLQHINLLTEEDWKQVFYSAGFQDVRTLPYLFAKDCRLWDTLDVLSCIGFKGYTIGGLVKLFGQMIPPVAKKVILSPTAKWLSAQLEKEASETPCAIVILGQK